MQTHHELGRAEIARRLRATAQHLETEIDGAKRARRLVGIQPGIDLSSIADPAPLEAKLASVQEALADIAREEAAERAQAEREAEQAERDRAAAIEAAAEAALVARKRFDRTQAERLRLSLLDDLDAYRAAAAAADSARDEYTSAQAALEGLQGE